MHVSQIASAEPVESGLDLASTIDELPVADAAAVAAANRLSLQMISILAERATFSVDEMKSMLALLQGKAAGKIRNRYGYDINAAFSAANRLYVLENVVQLSSRNLGYDFALVKVAAGRTVAGCTLFGSPKYEVRIYMSRLDEDEYVFLESAPSLAKAIGLIDKIYCQAADLHLA